MANQRLTDKTALNEQAGSNDILMIVDSSDTSSSAQGTSKKMDFKYLMQTDKFSLNNTEVQALNSSPKTLVGALSGYMVTPISCTILVTYASATEAANKNLYLGYDTSQTLAYWDYSSRFMNSLTDDRTFIFGGGSPTVKGVVSGSTLNKGFYMWSNGAFTGGWTCDVYLTYAYTKVL
tara:strand:- start:762 stop:1295 length:534 start_codon:yes stop_codon:yes gene_type:complete